MSFLEIRSALSDYSNNNKQDKLPVKSLEAEVTLECPLSVSPHVSEQHKASSELLIADCALEGLLSSVVPHVVIKNVSSVESFGTVGALEFLIISKSFSNLRIVLNY